MSLGSKVVEVNLTECLLVFLLPLAQNCTLVKALFGTNCRVNSRCEDSSVLLHNKVVAPGPPDKYADQILEPQPQSPLEPLEPLEPPTVQYIHHSWCVDSHHSTQMK